MANMLQIGQGKRMQIKGINLITEDFWPLENSFSLWVAMNVRSERFNNDMKNRNVKQKTYPTSLRSFVISKRGKKEVEESHRPKIII